MASKWYYRIGDDKNGPIESKALKLLAEVGQITPNTLVQKEGAKSWAEASRVKGLFTSSTTDTVNPPPILGEDDSNEPPVIPVATEFAYKVKPSKPVPVAAGVSEPPPMVAPAVITHAEGGESHKEFLEHKRRRRSNMPLLFTLLGIFVVTGVGGTLYYNFESDSPAVTPTTSTASNSQVASALPVIEEPAKSNGPEQQVFLSIRSFSDASRARMRLADGQVQLRIIEVWLSKSEKKVDGKTMPSELTMNVLLETENLDATNTFILNRESSVHAGDDHLNPYVALAQNGTDEFLSLQQTLKTQTIPPGGKISETLSFVLNSGELQQFKLAIPLAWFRQTGYTGYSIPDVMIADAPSVASVAQIPGTQRDKNVIEEVPGNPIVGQAQSSKTSDDLNTKEAVADTKPKENENGGKLPPPPDFGIPNKPDGENGDQPEDFNSLQKSIKASLNPGESEQNATQQANTSESTSPAEPVFK